MKKFVFLYYGNQTEDQGSMDAWNKWFGSIGDKLVDGGNPFGDGREITKTGTKELSDSKDAVTGYSIVNADNIDEAEKIAKGCPVTNVRVYEALPM